MVIVQKVPSIFVVPKVLHLGHSPEYLASLLRDQDSHQKAFLMCRELILVKRIADQHSLLSSQEPRLPELSPKS